MRFGQVDMDGAAIPVVAHDDDDGWHVMGGADGDLRGILARGPERVAAAVAGSTGSPLVDPVLTASVHPGKIVAIGLNYADHVRESKGEIPTRPLVFAKFPSSVIGSLDPIVVDPAVTTKVDWEVELAVVVGRRLQRISPAEALDGVFGYTVANDVSARDVQFADGQWVRGKSLDTFCPLGPMIVSPDELGDPQTLRLTTKVNGEVVQDSSTAEMIFSVAELLSYCSHSFTLEPGDVMITGTPWGCGAFMDPPRYLRDGDVVDVEVEGIGVLTNPVTFLSP